MAKGLCVSVLGMFVMACSGCGGGGGGSPVPVAQTAPPAAKAITIGANGDSITHGTVQNPDGTYRITDNTAPANLQKLLQANLGPTVTVLNRGLGGATVADVIQAAAGYKQWWKDVLATDPAQIEIAKWAVNDSNPIVNESTTVFENDLIYWIQITQAAGKTVVLEEPNPVCNPAMAALPQYVEVIDKVAAQLSLPLIKQYDYILSLPNWQSYLGADCTHPADDRLYQLTAQREYDVVQPIVARLLQ
ncbi:SGNH/GDSL hydrolase family protein [Paraburkholderia sp. BL17N1]|uniref:SGNH/GDSL hydrolase family protein n=1 Tax=Paraburkholderia sp. BL17N1 TaxID=1938798 RepID=UPI000F15B38A|nr:SGNH/GDSL hydrolase family protein [Paraburkholderia sp. BL17N1]RKR46329.1 lysophospholipase L1-like esterase [Paraburkholderia sp. BL17N1]